MSFEVIFSSTAKCNRLPGADEKGRPDRRCTKVKIATVERQGPSHLKPADDEEDSGRTLSLTSDAKPVTQ